MARDEVRSFYDFVPAPDLTVLELAELLTLKTRDGSLIIHSFMATEAEHADLFERLRLPNLKRHFRRGHSAIVPVH